MKTLTNSEIVFLLKACGVYNCKEAECKKYCPLWKECCHYFTGDKVGSCLEKEEKE